MVARGAATITLKMLPEMGNCWQKHMCHFTVASFTKAVSAGGQGFSGLAAPTGICLLPTCPHEELAAGQQVPFAGGKAKWC